MTRTVHPEIHQPDGTNSTATAASGDRPLPEQPQTHGTFLLLASGTLNYLGVREKRGFYPCVFSAKEALECLLLR